MILEVDCGNTLLKWRVLDQVGRIVSAAGAADDIDHLLAQLNELTMSSVGFVRVVSVRSDAETQALLGALECKFSVDVKLAISAPYLAGVTNGYREPHLLGADRWLAIVSAYSRSGSACLVLDVGTAVTSDFVSADGMHLGGYICPGVRLMRDQLGKQTRRINFLPGSRMDCIAPGKTTAEAVECGTQLMLVSFVESQVQMARKLLGERFIVFITGGDAALIAVALPDALIVPDLVFDGLALAFPE